MYVKLLNSKIFERQICFFPRAFWAPWAPRRDEHLLYISGLGTWSGDLQSQLRLQQPRMCRQSVTWHRHTSTVSIFSPFHCLFQVVFFQVPYKKKALLNSNYQMRYFIAKVIFDSQFRITGRSFEQASAPCLQRCFTGPIASLRRFSVSAALRIFRDIPRDPSRTCALDVDIYVTDFTNNAEHANPEVVDSWQKSQLQVEIFTSRPSRKSQHF